MKMLICTDGSAQSQKAIEKASIIAEGGKFSEVAFINVYNKERAMPFTNEGIAGQQMESFQNIISELKQQGEQILSDAANYFNVKDIKTDTILKEGPPADTIVNVAREEGFEDIAVSFKEIAEVEEFHEGRYRTLAANVANGEVFKKKTSVKWHCTNCGYVHEGLEAPEECPACKHPQAYYELLAENY